MSEGNKKDQIILTHTSRKGEDFLKSLECRYNGVYDKLPHYVILKDGSIQNILDDEKPTNFFESKVLNKQSVVICLENLGWLNKKLLSQQYINWIGNVVENNVKERKWRTKIFWDKYTDEQMGSLITLCNTVCEKHNIPKKFIGHNTRLDNLEKYKGILNRSNLHDEYTDLSPAFNFVYLLENFNHD